jgi:hypothetical protein
MDEPSRTVVVVGLAICLWVAAFCADRALNRRSQQTRMLVLTLVLAVSTSVNTVMLIDAYKRHQCQSQVFYGDYCIPAEDVEMSVPGGSVDT